MCCGVLLWRAVLWGGVCQERDGKDVSRGEAGKLAGELRRVERQRAELLVAFKKQLKLIEVLKRQKVRAAGELLTAADIPPALPWRQKGTH